MIRFSVLYPGGEDSRFDHDYYRDQHVPLAKKTWGVDVAEIDRGVNGPYVAAVHFQFASQDALNEALGSAGTATVQGDVANYTDIEPVIQISEMV